MKKKEFEDTLRSMMRREPFAPFVVELVNGVRIELDAPGSVAFNGGAAGYLSATGEPTFFNSQEVRRFVPGAKEPA